MNLKDKIWSYSSVKLFESCPYAFKLKYIDGIEERPNAMAQCGKLAHSILERYFKGELMAFELADVFEAEYADAVTERFPFFNMYRSFYEKTYEYFLNFEGLDDKYEVVAVEQEVKPLITRNFNELVPVSGYRFVGYIDLILRDEQGLVIVDHKSHGAWKSKKERHEYFSQLYLYAYAVWRLYGDVPYKLVFNKFRTGEWDEELVNAEDSREALEWFVSGIDRAMSERDWDCKFDKFGCDSLCGFEDCVFNGRAEL